MKKDNHILINLSDDDYILIKTIATLERRSISEISRLILIDNAKKLYNQKYAIMQPAVFIPENN